MKKLEFENKVLGYFEPAILSSYQMENNKYEVKTNHLSGEVNISSAYYNKLDKVRRNDKYIRVRFGYRFLKNGEQVIVAFLPDLFKSSEEHIRRWTGFLINNPVFPKRIDKKFIMWKEIALEGSWKHRSLVTVNIREITSRINGLFEELFGKPFFKYGILDNINFPILQNSHSYQDAIAELDGYFIDGIDFKTLKLTSEKYKIVIKSPHDKTLSILKEIFPEINSTKYFKKAVELLRKQRGIARHGKRSQAVKLNAFEKFLRDLELIYKGHKELLKIFERKFKINALKATRRNSAKKWLPLIIKKPEPNYSINKIEFMKGKKIQNIEYGHRESIEGLHESEAIIFTFTDSSMMGLETGSNVGNIVSSNYKRLKEEDFHVDFFINTVPSLK